MIKKREKGFTLVELLAVIVILAIILVIAVPKVMSVIEDSKKATLETTVKMIASSAEKKLLENKVLEKTENITCDSVVNMNDLDYGECNIKFENNIAKVTLEGKGKFDGLYVCNGVKTSASATNDICEGMCSKDNIKTKYSSVSNPYQVGNYDVCINFFKEEEGENFNQEIYNLICNDEEDEYGETLEDYLSWRIEDGLYTEDDLVEKNVIKVNDIETCIPKYSSNMTDYVNILYNKVELRELMGLDKDNTEDQNIRYAGSNKVVKNYVEFGNTGELWRIIGTFNVETSEGETEKLVKLIKNEPFEDVNGAPLLMPFDVNESDEYGQSINQWGESKYKDGTVYEGADLKRLLNGYYIGTANTTCMYCELYGEQTCSNDCSNSVTPISSTYKNMIENVVWNTGAYVLPSEVEENRFYFNVLEPKKLYEAERSTNIPNSCDELKYDDNGTEYCNELITRTTEWKGLVALPYATDWAYASSSPECRNDIFYDSSYSYNWNFGGACTLNNWLTQMNEDIDAEFMFLTPFQSTIFSGGGSLISWGNTTITIYNDFGGGVYPSLYLKSNVKIISGNGSKENPYKLGI